MEVIQSETYQGSVSGAGSEIDISLIVLSYNNIKFIEQCLSTVSNQANVRYEIIIGDDGSSDGSKDYLRSFIISTKSIAVAILSKHNRGIVPNYNSCLSRCRGQYIAHVASDDFLSLDRLSLQFNALEHSGASMCVSSLYVVDSEGQFIRKRVLPSGWVRYKDSGFSEGRINLPSPTMMYRKSLIDIYGELPNHLFNEDEILGARAINQAGIVSISDCTTYYRRHDSSVTSGASVISIIDFINWQEKNIPLRIANVREYINVAKHGNDKFSALAKLNKAIDSLTDAFIAIAVYKGEAPCLNNFRILFNGTLMLLKLYSFGFVRWIRDMLYRIAS